MGHFTKPILELIARNPRGLRTIEIADKVDCDPDLVEYSIRESLAVSEVLVEDVMGPNDRPAKAYYPTDRLIAKYPAPKVVEAPIIPKPTKSKAEIGIEFIKTADFNVVDEDLRRVMGLTKMQYPSAWLSGAMANGLVHRDGKYWLAGFAGADVDVPVFRKEEGATIEVPAAASILEPDITVKQFEGVDIDKLVTKAGPEKSNPIQTAIAVDAIKPAVHESGEFSCALWSDGELQIRRSGRVTETLTANEARELVDYLAKSFEIATEEG